MQRALWFQSDAPALLINSLLRSPVGFGVIPLDPYTGQRDLNISPKAHSGVWGQPEHPPSGGHHFWVPLAGGFTGCRHAAVWAGGWMGPHAHPHPKHPGCRTGSHRAQVGRLGGREGMRAGVGLPPPHGPHRGSRPHNYSIRHKITEQGRSLPAPSWPPCLSHPPPPLPEPSWHRTHSHGPHAAAGSPSHSGTSLCPRLHW